MKYYIQTDKFGYIADIIDYEHDGYIQIEYDYPLPAGVQAGWYSYNNGAFLLDAERQNSMKYDSDLETALRIITEGEPA